MSGRGLGYCAGYDAPGYYSGRPGRGRGGWGARNRYYATGVPGRARFYGGRHFSRPYAPYAPYAAPTQPPVVDEASALKAQAEYLTEALDEIRTRLAELEEKSGE